MEKYVLVEKDIMTIKELLKLSSSISTLYKRLCDLEINGKESTLEYQKVLNYLEVAVEVEDKKYEGLSGRVAIAMFEYIAEDNISIDFLSDAESIMRQDYSNRSTRRVLNNLWKIVFDNPVLFADYAIDNKKKYSDMVLKSASEDLKKIKDFMEKTEKSLMLNFLNEYICNSNDQIKGSLINAKYILFILINI